MSEDPYTSVALNVPLENITVAQRQVGKSVALSSPYGGLPTSPSSKPSDAELTAREEGWIAMKDIEDSPYVQAIMELQSRTHPGERVLQNYIASEVARGPRFYCDETGEFSNCESWEALLDDYGLPVWDMYTRIPQHTSDKVKDLCRHLRHASYHSNGEADTFEPMFTLPNREYSDNVVLLIGAATELNRLCNEDPDVISSILGPRGFTFFSLNENMTYVIES